MSFWLPWQPPTMYTMICCYAYMYHLSLCISVGNKLTTTTTTVEHCILKPMIHCSTTVVVSTQETDTDRCKDAFPIMDCLYCYCAYIMIDVSPLVHLRSINYYYYYYYWKTVLLFHSAARTSRIVEKTSWLGWSLKYGFNNPYLCKPNCDNGLLSTSGKLHKSIFNTCNFRGYKHHVALFVKEIVWRLRFVRHHRVAVM